ncbi:MAG TPA: peptide ABC transporter permease [Dehalococcoidia bacterium]|jgi:ABC-type dipeptide/oligopeptide/nickel transport system permease subunit|nr:peptide ABC transporter permease [Chloroflexota bacterium]HCE75563.1 peptide ABC transporter permease [Dehalococcoidia bacterium]|tara:strand:+ start:3709 stop:4584 length:876 start_codon:yes stop_codon:yes gene_type:complete
MNSLNQIEEKGQKRRKANFIWRFQRNKLAVIGLCIVVVCFFIAAFANFLAPTSYDVGNLVEARQPPSWGHVFGTDGVGRDYLSRIIYATRTSIMVALGVQVITLTIGISLGTLGGYLGGWVDQIVVRIIEIATGIPALLIAMFIMGLLGHSMWNVIFALGISGWVVETRITRGQFLAFKEREFVVAAQAIGASQFRVAFRHIFPNIIPILAVLLAFQVPAVIFNEAGLSFLGLGIDEPVPSLGKMISTSLAYVRTYWHMGLFPSLMIAIITMGFTFVGDGLRDALDPTMNR